LTDNKKILAARKGQVMEIDREIEKLEVRLMEMAQLIKSGSKFDKTGFCRKRAESQIKRAPRD